ncbi:MAG: hypothetical protein R3F19_35205 [Verrucomicrobiales bacterium]
MKTQFTCPYSSSRLLIGALLCLVAAVVIIFLKVADDRKQIAAVEPAASALSSADAIGDNGQTVSENSPVDPAVRVLREALMDGVQRLKERAAVNSADDTNASAVLRSLLSDSLAEPALEVVLALLDSGIDAPTGESFDVGMDGFLQSAPTVRVLLLDFLGELNAQVATQYARKILDATDATVDERAIALRNYATGSHLSNNSEAAIGDSYLIEKVQQTIAQGRASNEPTPGFLHALDFAVLAPTPDAIVELSELSIDGGQHAAVRRVAAAQLNRLASRDFPRALGTLQSTGTLGTLPGARRAQLFSYADVRDSDSAALLEAYLASPVEPDELNRFANLFPNFGLQVTNHLATQNPAVQMTDDADAVIEAWLVVQAWRTDDRFAEKDAALALTEARLERLVTSIRRGLSADTN